MRLRSTQPGHGEAAAGLAVCAFNVRYVRHGGRPARRVLVAAVLALAVLLLCAVPGHAAVVWRVASAHGPANMPLGDGDSSTAEGQYVIQVYNIGTTDTNDVYTVEDVLPPGVTATSTSGDGWTCPGATGASTVDCTQDGTGIFGTLYAPTVGGGDPGKRGVAPTLFIEVSVDVGAPGVADNTVTVSGGDSGGPPPPAVAVDTTAFSATSAGFGLVGGRFGADVFKSADPSAVPERQAGAHPSEARFELGINLKRTVEPVFGGPFTEPDEKVHSIEVSLPRGLIGNPEAVPKCTDRDLLTGAVGYGSIGTCPPASQVGSVDLLVNNVNAVFPFNQPSATQDLPVYNMVPPRGYVAAFAFALQGFGVYLLASLDPADHYGVKTTIRSVTELLPLRSTQLTLWGVPADASHDALRFNPAVTTQTPFYGTSANIEPKPFLTLPSQCQEQGSARMTLDSWQHVGVFVHAASTPATMTGCDKQLFNASIDVAPSTLKADSPAGLSFDLNIPQDLTATGLGTPPLRKAVVTFPEGMSVSPSSADGLAACTPAQIGLGTNDVPTCPDASKIGTATLTTPLLPLPVEGSVYLASQNENPFGTMIALYIVIHDQERGLVVKLPGKVDTDPISGRVTTTFDDNPQLPFSKLALQLFTGPRAPLATPTTCGLKTVTAELTSWNETMPVVKAMDSFTISGDGKGAPCGPPHFDPSFKAGTSNPVAGADSPFAMTLVRADGDQELSGLSLSMPRGLLAHIADVPLCTDAAAGNGTCGEGSRIGTVVVGAGPGSNPFFITNGGAYITGPYKGAPFGLSIVVPAVAGPFDLGNVVVRAAIEINRETAALKIVSDPLPTILQGIPLRVRVVHVNVDRKQFTLNPTSCREKAISTTLTSTGGLTASKTARFQVTNCAALSFRPRMSLRVGRKGHTRAGGSAPLVATVRMGKGQANLSSVKVVLPLMLNARLAVVEDACTRAEFDAGHCEHARAGTAVASTPLLKDPLRGGAYFVKNGHALPDLIVALRGQVDVDLAGKITIPGSQRLATTFDAVPDVPITKFTLRIVDGARGPIGIAENLCTKQGRRAKAQLTFHSQSGKRVHRGQQLKIVGCPQGAKR